MLNFPQTTPPSKIDTVCQNCILHRVWLHHCPLVPYNLPYDRVINVHKRHHRMSGSSRRHLRCFSESHSAKPNNAFELSSGRFTTARVTLMPDDNLDIEAFIGAELESYIKSRTGDRRPYPHTRNTRSFAGKISRDVPLGGSPNPILVRYENRSSNSRCYSRSS